VVPINFLQLTLTLYSLDITTPIYYIKYSVPFMTNEFDHTAIMVHLEFIEIEVDETFSHVNCSHCEILSQV
jgi:hypothetical protein